MRVSDERFREFLTAPTTTIHALTTDENDYGEFLFVTLSRLANKARIFMTFYGLGYHDYRERWIMRDWFWHQATATPELRKKRIPVETALAQIIARIDDITPNLKRTAQTPKGQFFEVLADMTDDDFAFAEIEDLSRDESPPWELPDEDEQLHD